MWAKLHVSFAALAALSCAEASLAASRPEVRTRHAHPPLDGPSAARAATEAMPGCPRLPRGKRIWAGFAHEVPSAAMHLALDAIVPIQVKLGEVFCARAYAACRPARLQSIVLQDETARVAVVALENRDGSVSELRMSQAREDVWLVEPESMRAFISTCLRTPQREPPDAARQR